MRKSFAQVKKAKKIAQIEQSVQISLLGGGITKEEGSGNIVRNAEEATASIHEIAVITTLAFEAARNREIAGELLSQVSQFKKI